MILERGLFDNGRGRVNIYSVDIPLEERTRIIANLREELEQHGGEFVLVVSREEYFPRTHDDRWSQMRTVLHMGIVRPPFMEGEADGGLLRISTGGGHSYLRGTGTILSANSDLGGVIPMMHVHRFGEKINGFPALEIIVGDQAVATWFSNYAQWHRIDEQGERPTVERWKESNSEGYLRWKAQYFDKNALLTFLRMQKALGREIKMASEPAQQEFEEVIEQEKLGILKRINQSSHDAFRLREDIERSLELGMHIEPRTITQNPKRGVKVEIDVPELIKGYCERYGIEFPTESK